MSGSVKSIISQLPNLSARELLEVQLMIELYLKNQAIDFWEDDQIKLPAKAQKILNDRVASYERGDLEVIPYKDALNQIRYRLK